MTDSIDRLVETLEGEDTRRSFLKKTLGATGIALGLGAILPSEAQAGSVTEYRNRKGKVIGSERTFPTGRIDGDPNTMPPSGSEFWGKGYDELMEEGIEAYTNHQYKHAEQVFRYTGSDLKPGSLEPKVWRVKSLYQKIYKENEWKGEKLASEDGTHHALGMIKEYKKTMDSPAFDALAKRFEKNEHPLEFNIEAWQKYAEGKKAFDSENYSKAAGLLRESTKLDRWNNNGWDYLAYSEGLKNGKNQQKACDVWAEAKKYLPEFSKTVNKFCN